MKDNAKLWVGAMRSGKYPQGRRRLIDENGCYCCLGIACAICPVAPVGWEKLKVLPDEVREWLGLKYCNGSYRQGPSLSLDNDAGKTFFEIAAIVEREPDGLFVEVGAK